MTEAATENTGTHAETHAFDAEVHQLLKLMISALYSNREIFLRELISNASDAIDKLRFLSLTDSGLQADIQAPSIDLSFDAEAGELVIEDTGIGMTRDEVVENLGTIARSGTARFLESLSGDEKKDASLIGQFGVGFYSSFIVADQVTVETLKAGQPNDTAVRWQSEGQGEYTLETIERDRHGTRIVLKLGQDHRDLLDAHRLRGIIQHYSNHVAFPIRLEQVVEASGESESSESESCATEFKQINDTQALWTRPKAEIGEQDYQEFYGGLTGDFEPPSIWTHHHVEGTQCYSLLLYLPSRAPFDLAWNRDERSGLKLYINRVFIMDAAESLVPRYLRFVRGIVDSADLPLNVSREILQDSPLLGKIRAAVVRRSLEMLEKLAEQGGEAWQKVRDEFGNVLKEGIIEDPDNRERIAALLRFDSTHVESDEKTSLSDYLQRAGEDQPTIWYLLAESRDRALSSPHLEAFRKRDIEVLLLTDPIDHWLVNHLFEFDGKSLKSAASGELDLDSQSSDEPQPDDKTASSEDENASTDDNEGLVGSIKQALGDRVGRVIVSKRLVDSASCLVEPAGALNAQMRKMLKQAGQDVPDVKPDLEVNLDHPLLRLLVQQTGEEAAAHPETEALANILLDQALLVEGGELSNPAGFVKQVNELLEKLMQRGSDG